MSLLFDYEYQCECKDCGKETKEVFGTQLSEDDSKHKMGTCPQPGCEGELKKKKGIISIIDKKTKTKIDEKEKNY
jgi:hypothetical protein